MTIVPIGKLVVQVGAAGKREEYQQGLIGGMKEAVKEVVKRCIEVELEGEVTRVLKRKAHGRSKRVSNEAQGTTVCRKCGNGKPPGYTA